MRNPVKLNALSPYDASPVPNEMTQTIMTSFPENAFVPKQNAANKIATGANASVGGGERRSAARARRVRNEKTRSRRECMKR